MDKWPRNCENSFSQAGNFSGGKITLTKITNKYPFNFIINEIFILQRIFRIKRVKNPPRLPQYKPKPLIIFWPIYFPDFFIHFTQNFPKKKMYHTK